MRGCPGGVGLTTALMVLRSGWVVVGSLPTKNGSDLRRWLPDRPGPVGARAGDFTGYGINGPWDMAALDQGNQAVLFVTNVLNGTVAAKGGTVYGGTVLRLVVTDPAVRSAVRSGPAPRSAPASRARLNPAALVIGPTGVGLGPRRRPVRR